LNHHASIDTFEIYIKEKGSQHRILGNAFMCMKETEETNINDKKQLPFT